MSIKYIVTGTGRCGTMFMSKYLTSAGINCGHEVIFTNAGIESASKNLFRNNTLEADASYMAAPFLNHSILANAKIIHIVRDPIKVINSFVVGYNYFLSPLLNCAKFSNIWTYAYPPGSDPEFKFMNFIYTHVPELQSLSMSAIERAALYYIQWNKMIEKSCKDREFILFPIESDLATLNRFLEIEYSDKLHSDTKTNSYEYKNQYSLASIQSQTIKKDLLSLGLRYGYFKTPIL